MLHQDVTTYCMAGIFVQFLPRNAAFPFSAGHLLFRTEPAFPCVNAARTVSAYPDVNSIRNVPDFPGRHICPHRNGFPKCQSCPHLFPLFRKTTQK